MTKKTNNSNNEQPYDHAKKKHRKKKYIFIFTIAILIFIFFIISQFIHHRFNGYGKFNNFSHHNNKNGHLSDRDNDYSKLGNLKWNLNKSILSDSKIWNNFEQLKSLRIQAAEELKKDNFDPSNFNKLLDRAQVEFNSGFVQIKKHINENLIKLSLSERKSLAIIIEQHQLDKRMWY